MEYCCALSLAFTKTNHPFLCWRAIMLIAQITDIHLHCDADNPENAGYNRLRTVLEHLRGLSTKPDLLLITGDMTERGDAESYRMLAEIISGYEIPVYLCLGNHDRRNNFCKHFQDAPKNSDFVQYALTIGPLRLIVLDTLQEGRHGGAFCEQRAGWLTTQLAQDLTIPTIIAMHHPPVKTGIQWMEADEDELWTERFSNVIADAPNIKAILCGHLHRQVSIGWKGTTVAICGSTAPQIMLDFSPLDPEKPDNRPLIVDSAPAYALHYWNGRDVITHFCQARENAVLARFDSHAMPMMMKLSAEHSSTAAPNNSA
jgi:3',5'-cyclic-AMP phosphodiesterase